MGSSYEEFSTARTEAVQLLWRQDVDADHAQLVVPDGAADVIVSADGLAVLVGPTTDTEVVSLLVGSRLRGLRLRPGVVGAALGLPASELRGRTLPLSDAVPAALARRLRLVAVGELAPSRLELPVDDRVRVAVGLLRRGLSMDHVVETTAVSSRQLRRLFLASAGIGPKAMQRVLRLQRFIRSAEVAASINLAALAVGSGYADQAHLSREVRSLTDRTPTELLRARGVAETCKPAP